MNAGRRTRLAEAPLVAAALVAATLTIALQCTRVFLPAAYIYRESSGLSAAALVGVLVFAAPLLAPVVVAAVGPRRAMLLAAATLAALRIAIQAADPPGIGLTAVAAASGLIAFTAAVIVVHDRVAVVVGIVAGLVLDTLLRAAASTWDFAFRGSAMAWIVTAALAIAVVGSGWVSRPDRSTEPAGNGLLAGLALGPFLALQVLLLQNVAFVSSSGGVALATGAVVVLGGDALAVGACWLVISERTSRGVAVMSTVLLAVVAWLATAATGASVVAVVLLGQGLATLLVARAVVSLPTSSVRRRARELAGFGGGTLVLGLLVVGYQLHYDRPLPVTNRWIPVIAAVLLGAVATVARPAVAGATTGRRSVRWALSGATAVTVVGALTFGALAISEPELSPARVAPHELTVMTYNVHETVARDGRLDPEGMARAVRRVDPDVLVVEEAARGWPLSAGLDLAEWAKRRLDMPYVWAPAADHQLGNVLFSRVPVLSAKVVHLPKGTGPTNRSAVVARVGPVDHRIVTVVGTHLQNGEGRDRVQARVAEIETILRTLGARAHTVILGDLNSDPGSPELHTLLDAGYRTTQPTRSCTLKTSNANCVDWIFVSRDLEQTTVRAIAIDTFDHRPLVATVRPRT
jgi:endonuclease/exonuclease/phosphatase family metal-dependent hydrolase